MDDGQDNELPEEETPWYQSAWFIGLMIFLAIVIIVGPILTLFLVRGRHRRGNETFSQHY